MSSITASFRRPDPRSKVTLPNVIRSEWTKLFSVRSTRWSLLSAFLLTVGLAALACFVVYRHWPHMSASDRRDFHPLEVDFVGIQLAQLAIGALGVLLITAEYSTGMIRSSIIAVPRRLPVLYSKAIVFAGVTLGLMIPAAFLAFLVGQSILSGRHASIGLGHPGVVRALIGAGLYLAVVGLFGLGLGSILRNTAGGIAAFAGVMFVLPPLMNVLPTSWNDAASPYLPLQAGEQILSITPGNQLSPWAGLGVFSLYAASSLALAAVLLARRDT